jgi:hypothetical protein
VHFTDEISVIKIQIVSFPKKSIPDLIRVREFPESDKSFLIPRVFMQHKMNRIQPDKLQVMAPYSAELNGASLTFGWNSGRILRIGDRRMPLPGNPIDQGLQSRLAVLRGLAGD